MNLTAGEYLGRFSLKFNSIAVEEDTDEIIEEVDLTEKIQVFMNN